MTIPITEYKELFDAAYKFTDEDWQTEKGKEYMRKMAKYLRDLFPNMVFFRFYGHYHPGYQISEKELRHYIDVYFELLSHPCKECFWGAFNHYNDIRRKLNIWFISELSGTLIPQELNPINVLFETEDMDRVRQLIQNKKELQEETSKRVKKFYEEIFEKLEETQK